MKYYLPKMEENLSDNDRRLLQQIYEPVVVTIPPADACQWIRAMPDGEIRIYGWNHKNKLVHHEDCPGEAVYISSRNCGLSWHTVSVEGKPGLRYAIYDPKTGRSMEAIVKHHDFLMGREIPDFDKYPDSMPLLLITEGDPDGEISKVVSMHPEPTIHVPRNGIRLKKKDRLLYPGHKNLKPWEFVPVVYYSDDDGDSWTTVQMENLGIYEPQACDKGIRWQNFACEPTVEELEDGTLMMVVRTTTDYYYEYYSYDSGETWTLPIQSVFHGTNTMPTLYKLSDGRLLLFHCATQMLPELDQKAYDPPVGKWEIQGWAEDYFTNRDANHLAISEDNGKTWIGYRELYLNDIRNNTDYRSVGGVGTSYDKSVHQGQILELPYNKVLIHFGQNESSRKVVILDLDWLYEKQRKEDFRTGLSNVSTQMFLVSVAGEYRKFSGHCAFNRTNGALLVPDPDKNFQEALSIARVHDPRLFSERQGMVWNFPSSKSGELKVRMRVMKSGVSVSLNDHWYNPFDEQAKVMAHLTFDVDQSIAPSDKWTDITVKFDVDQGAAYIYADGTLILEKEILQAAPLGLNYLIIQTLAEEEDFEGTLIKSMNFCGE